MVFLDVSSQLKMKLLKNVLMLISLIGNDDLGIVSNITNIISKEDKLVMRGINISSKDGLFSGNVTVMIDDATKTETLIKKLSAVKGVKQVIRI